MIHARMTCRWCAAVTGAAATLLVLAGAAGPAQAALHQTGAARPRPVTAYVVSSGSDTVTPVNTVTPIRTANNAPGRPVQVGKFPFAIAITPAGETAYVVNQAVTPDGKTAYVVGNLPDAVTPINTATNIAGHPFKAGVTPEDIAITP